MPLNTLETHFPLAGNLPQGVRFWWGGGQAGPEVRSFDRSEQGQKALADLAAELQVHAITRMRQVHGGKCTFVHMPSDELTDTDACVSTLAGAYGVMTADCLPVVACSSDGQQVGVAHAGWRGLAAGVLASWVDRFSCESQALTVWIGPAICHSCFQVGHDVVSAFEQAPEFENIDIRPHMRPDAFEAGKYRLDLKQLAVAQLRSLGVGCVVVSDLCTMCEPSLHSYRRNATHHRILCGVVKKDPS
ncbi:MAG: peptidoglycan editing factor PgeF [Halieaceae bacterium]|nr:peptidoglycan editing factor PgeF [Halieaceae bacterium]